MAIQAEELGARIRRHLADNDELYALVLKDLLTAESMYEPRLRSTADVLKARADVYEAEGKATEAKRYRDVHDLTVEAIYKLRVERRELTVQICLDLAEMETRHTALFTEINTKHRQLIEPNEEALQ